MLHAARQKVAIWAPSH